METWEIEWIGELHRRQAILRTFKWAKITETSGKVDSDFPALVEAAVSANDYNQLTAILKEWAFCAFHTGVQSEPPDTALDAVIELLKTPKTPTNNISDYAGLLLIVLQACGPVHPQKLISNEWGNELHRMLLDACTYPVITMLATFASLGPDYARFVRSLISVNDIAQLLVFTSHDPFFCEPLLNLVFWLGLLRCEEDCGPCRQVLDKFFGTQGAAQAGEIYALFPEGVNEYAVNKYESHIDCEGTLGFFRTVLVLRTAGYSAARVCRLRFWNSLDALIIADDERMRRCGLETLLRFADKIHIDHFRWFLEALVVDGGEWGALAERILGKCEFVSDSFPEEM